MGCNINGVWNNKRKIFEAKDKRENLHIIRVGRNGRICPIQYMVYGVHECTRLWDRKQCDISRQSKRDAYGEKWAQFMYGKLKTYTYNIFIYVI